MVTSCEMRALLARAVRRASVRQYHRNPQPATSNHV